MRNHHRIQWNAGMWEYDKLQDFLMNIVRLQPSAVLVKGEEKTWRLRQLLAELEWEDMSRIINIETLWSIPNIPTLSKSNERNDTHEHGMQDFCSVKIVNLIKQWIKLNVHNNITDLIL
jgi:hypothetical protein